MRWVFLCYLFEKRFDVGFHVGFFFFFEIYMYLHGLISVDKLVKVRIIDYTNGDDDCRQRKKKWPGLKMKLLIDWQNDIRMQMPVCSMLTNSVYIQLLIDNFTFLSGRVVMVYIKCYIS